jgi:hypothetical protein
MSFPIFKRINIRHRTYAEIALCLLSALAIAFFIVQGSFQKLAIFFSLGFGITLLLTHPVFYKKILIFAFFSLLFVPAMSVLRPQEINYSAYYAIILLGSALSYIAMRQSVKIDLLTIYFLWFIANAIIFWGITDVIQNYSLLTFPFTALSLYIILIESSEKEIVYFLKILMVTVIIQSLIGVSQSFFGWPIFSNIVDSLYQSHRNYFTYIIPNVSALVKQGSGTFEHFNGLGGLLSLTFPIFFGFWRAKRKSILRLWLMCVVFLGLFTTYSRGALLGAMIGSLFVFVLDSDVSSFKSLIVSLASIILVFIFLGTLQLYIHSTGNITSRVNTWFYAINYALQDPGRIIFGYGVYFFKKETLGIGPTLTNIHSGQLQILLELGIFGFSLFMLYLCKMFLLFLRVKRDLFKISLVAGVLGFFIHQFFDNALFGLLGIVMCCFLAILKPRLNKKNKLILEWWYGAQSQRNHR